MNTNAIASRVASSYLPRTRFSRSLNGGLGISQSDFQAAWDDTTRLLCLGSGPLRTAAFRKAYLTGKDRLSGLPRMVADFTNELAKEAAESGFDGISRPIASFDVVLSSCRVCPPKTMMSGVSVEAQT